MFPSSQPLAGDEHPPQRNLEDHLRGLILSNADQIPPSNTSVPPQAARTLPPHMMMATPEEQHEYWTRVAARPDAQHPPIPSRQQQPQLGRKKPNQAQRRQMNSQLSIPIDPRPNQNGQPLRGYGGNSQSSWSPQHFNGYHQPQHNQRYPQQSPRFQPPASPYSPRGNYSQGPQPSPGPQFHTGNHYQPRQGQHQLQGEFSPGTPGFTGQPYTRPPPQNRQLFQPGMQYNQGRGRPFSHNSEDISNQCTHLERLLQECVPNIEIKPEEEAAKESFRAVVEKACCDSISEYEQQELGNSKFDVSTVELKCFGSMSSGFATKASDMDLALLTPHSIPAADSPESPIPRLLEKKLLDAGYGARLLTRTRVPIIKLCEKPTEKLRVDLLEERSKWENGFVAEGEDEEEESNERESRMDGKNDQPLQIPAPKAAESATQKATESCHGDTKSQLKQKENQSLGDYHNNAKRHLRKLGGFDLSASAPELSPEQSKILNDVCKSFISGLASDALSTQLRTYKSISPLFDESEDFTQRSLNGVWTQIEGERLAIAFDSRPLTEANERHESECFEVVESWRALQNKCGPFTEPLLYNRQLYMACEKLKKFSSLQLVFLEQIQYEDPVQYSSRAKRVLDDLKGFQPAGPDTVTPIIIAHYVSGISNQQIREDMQKLMSFELDFSQVVFKHRILQLAVDYEHAIKKDIYDDVTRPYVEQYINFLKEHAKASTSSPIDSELLGKIRTLPDPTLTSLNKPRDRYRDHLEFPKTDIGIQCDINFSAHLALHNTLLLRCYSHSDPRVRLLILFVKHWAKARGINTPYRGTLSSYGYVLMVLHYLVNIASPFVCPNLQLLHREPPSYLPPAEIEARTSCNGRDVRFWRNEAEIKDISLRGLLNHNHDSVGVLLRGFFEYFAQNGQMSTVQNRGFDWGREVLSLRTQGGILTKQEKGWVGAKTVYETTTIAAPPTSSAPVMKVTSPKDLSSGVSAGAEGEASEIKTPKLQMKMVEETKEIRHRYLFAVEDPFELDHNVARTVTHNGIVSIRDEFRRAWRIIRNMGRESNEDLLAPVLNDNDMKDSLQELLDHIHGPQQDGKLSTLLEGAVGMA